MFHVLPLHNRDKAETLPGKRKAMRNQNIWILIALLVASAFMSAQWLNHPTPGIPRTPDGKPNLSAPTPHAADGKPNLSGLWQTEPAPPQILERFIPGATNGSGDAVPSQYFFNIFSDFKPEDAPLRPDAAELFRQRAKIFEKVSPLSHCL